jgi:hypothetical protein
VRNNKRGEYTLRILVAQGGDYHIGHKNQMDGKFATHVGMRNPYKSESDILKVHAQHSFSLGDLNL